MLELAGGSVLGRDHKRVDLNNQDSFRFVTEGEVQVAVVCDGCGEGGHSEVGAQIGSYLLTTTLLRNIHLFGKETYLPRVREDVLAQMRVLALSMGDSLSAVLSRNFLFTIVGMVATENRALFFSLGDGIVIANGKKHVIGPYHGNAPPYIAYGLVENDLPDQELLKFQVIEEIPTPELDHFLLGSDGLMYLIDAEAQKVPGKEELVGSISQFWENDLFFQNPDFVRRRLKVVNRDLERINWIESRVEHIRGYLDDDTTLIVGRKKWPAQSS